MISPAHQRAIRAAIVAALVREPGEHAAIPEVPLERCGWTPIDHAPPGPAFCSLQTIASEELGAAAGEVLERAEVDPDNPAQMLLAQYVRKLHDVTVSVQLAVAPNDAAQSLANNAWALASRMLGKLGRDEAQDDLTAAGVALERIGGIRDLTALVRGSQWESRVAVDLVVRIAKVDRHVVGWIERATGTGTLQADVPGGVDASLAVPFEAPPDED